MRAMVYRGPYKIRVEEKDVPPIEHPNDAIVRVTLAAICGSDLHREFSHHGIASRVGKKRADLAHQPLDAIIVAAPWVLGGRVAYAGLKRLQKVVTRNDRD